MVRLAFDLTGTLPCAEILVKTEDLTDEFEMRDDVADAGHGFQRCPHIRMLVPQLLDVLALNHCNDYHVNCPYKRLIQHFLIFGRN